ncbi:MAG: hypothetical protein ACOYXB_05155 [Bacteroidota bacterium]
MKRLAPATILLLALLLAGCAAYKPTPIENNYSGTLSSVSSAEKIPVLCSYYYLKSVDDIEYSNLSRFMRDQEIARNEVEEQLKTVCMGNPQCPDNFLLTTDMADITADKYIDFRIYQFVNWADVFLQILPIYYSVNGSYYVTAEVVEFGNVTKKAEEWGYVKTSGFWIISFKDQPNSLELRAYLVQKVLTELLAE